VIQLLDPATGALVPLAGAWDVKGMVEGVASAARFSTPYGVAVVNGTIIVADFDNNRLRSVGLDGTVTTLAGAGTAGFADGAAASARFNKPQGVAADAAGTIYVTDLDNFRVRRITGGTVDTIAGNGTGGFLDSDDRLGSMLYGLEGLGVSPDGAMVFVADGGRGEDVPYNRVRSVKLR
jgi:DNA-binding beta-propeller fold protein YncE